MPLNTVDYTTGPSTLSDDPLSLDEPTDTLVYNGCVFSPLFETMVSGNAVKDNANRTVMYMEYTITVDGYVTLPTGDLSVHPVMLSLRQLLMAQGGNLVYRGRGMDIIVNPPGAILGSVSNDVAWGPVPEILEFQPLGGGRSAKVKWEVKVRIPELAAKRDVGVRPFLQFNYETTCNYSEDGYSSLTVKGTMEIPMTRITQKTRTLTATIDDFRVQLDRRIFRGIDLTRFTIKRRDYNVSRDKRVMEFNVQVDEKPYMDLPPYSTMARGTYSVRPAKAGMGLVMWLCTLRASYTVRADMPRRWSWIMFMWLLRLRMASAFDGNIPKVKDGDQNPGKIAVAKVNKISTKFIVAWLSPLASIFGSKTDSDELVKARPWLIDFSFEEGLYQDSKTTSFSATWRMVTTFSHILLASGVWKKLPEQGNRNENLWETSMNVAGSLGGQRTGPNGVMCASSWLRNRIDPKLDIIVDFAGGD